MGIFSGIREFVWPLLEPVTESEIRNIGVEEIEIDEMDLQTCFDLTLRYYDSENEREKTIETKSTIFIGSIGFVIAILLNMTTGVLLNPTIPTGFLKSFSVIAWVIVVIYLGRAVWFSVKALERRHYDTIAHDDYIRKTKNFKKEFITEVINKVRRNSRTINLKVDDMVMAQLYFKRGIVAIALYSVIAAITSLSPGSLGALENWVLLLPAPRCNWLTVLNVCFLLINIAMLVLLFVRIKKR